MRRTQIYLDEELNEQLRNAAAAEGRSAAALVRDAVRLYLAMERLEAWDPMLAAIGSIVGLPPDAAVSHDRDLYDAPVAQEGVWSTQG